MERLLYNGNIWTGDRAYPTCSAIHIKDGVILALGSDEELATLLEKETVTAENLNGRTVLPGFVDSHMHLLDYGKKADDVPLFDAQSLEEVLCRCRERIPQAKKEGSWISGIGFNQDIWEEKVIPTRKDLDRISTEIPITIRRSCFHLSVCNTRALEVMGLMDGLPEEDRDCYDLYEDGTPNGILRETAQFMIAEHKPKRSLEELKALIVQVCEEAAAMGITEIQTDDFHEASDAGVATIAAYRELAENDELPIRVYEQAYAGNPKSLQKFLDLGYRTGDGWGNFRFGPIKLVMDGSLGSHSAFLRQPYRNDPEKHGLPYYEKEEIYTLCKMAHDNGMQIATHCIGDASLEYVLDAYRRIQEENPRVDPRHGIVHCQIMDEAQQEEFRKQNLLGYVQPIFVKADMEIVDDCVGEELGASSYNWRALWDKGVHLSGGSDCPVEYFDVMKNIQYAVTRTNFESGKSWHPENCLTMEETLKMFTYEGAYASFAENSRGSITVGKEADLVVLSDDPFSVQPELLGDIQVLETIVKGKTVFAKTAEAQ